MPSVPSYAENTSSVLRPSVTTQVQKTPSGHPPFSPTDMKQSRHQPPLHQDGLPRTYLSPFHRSSTPTVAIEGKENGNPDQRQQIRYSKPPVKVVERQSSEDNMNNARLVDQRRNQTAWSPRRGKREQDANRTPSVPASGRTMTLGESGTPMRTDVDDVNRDFERLMDKFQLSDTIRSRLIPLDTPLKRSLLCSPLALNSLIGTDTSTRESPSRPAFGHLRAQSTLPSEAMKQSSPQNRRTKSSQSAGQDVAQIRKMASGSSLRGVERGAFGSNRNSTAGMKTEFIENAKFVVLNGSPVRHAAGSRLDSSAMESGKGKRASYHHTHDGIPVPPPLMPHPDALSPDLQDNEYDFMHDLSRTSTVGDAFLGCSRDKYASTIGTSSSNSSADSRSHEKKSTQKQAEKKTKQKRSSIFSTKTRGLKKDGYTTAGEESFAHSTVSMSTPGKDNKRRSYTFGNSFSKSKTPLAGDDAPLSTFSTKKASMATMRQNNADLPLELATFVRDANTFEMDVDKVKRLRLLLGSESTAWIKTFIGAGGYDHLLARLQDLLDIDWRSEQHDDQLFFEILRCIKGLTTSEPGKAAIVAHGTSPFRELVDLLYSEKKPGEVPPKQLIVDLVFSLFDLYRSSLSADPMANPSTLRSQESSLPPADNRSNTQRPKSILISPPLSSSRTNMHESTTASAIWREPEIPGGFDSISGFIMSLLREPPSTDDQARETDHNNSDSNRRSRIIAPASELPAPKVEMHDFLAAAHRPRVFQTYLKELSQACWDFFWIMHYSKNGIWNFADVDTDTIKPKAPNGASAGVELEAMRYLTSHFRLINTLARTLIEQDMANEAIRQDMRKGQACQFHADLMFSGMDRILCTVRKASTDLYPEFHLELARYLKLATEAEYNLPYVIKALIMPPPNQYRRMDLASSRRQPQTQSPRRNNHRPQAIYMQDPPLDALNAGSAAQATKWLETPTETGDFDFQL